MTSTATTATSTSGVINFYSNRDKIYGCFSNFSLHPIELDGKVWKTSEHYFQAMKFQGTPHEEEVRQCSSPSSAAKLGRMRTLPLRKDWEKVKHDVMHRAVLAKFETHANIRSVLLGTGDMTLVEHTKNDSYWGDGGDGSGRNELGKMLMRVRTELRNKTAAEP